MKPLLLAVLALVFVVVLLELAGVQSISTVARQIALPLWEADSIVSHSGSGLLSFLQEKRKLAERIKELERERAGEEAKHIFYAGLEEENKELRRLLGLSLFSSVDVWGEVVKRPPDILYDTLIVRVGEGVQANAWVVAEGRIVIGKVRRVAGDVAPVELLSSPSVETEVLVGTSSRATAKGVGAGNFVIELPREIEISEGSIVRISGLGPLILGQVSEVEVRSADPFALIRFRLPINLDAVRFVEFVPLGSIPMLPAERGEHTEDEENSAP